MLLTTVASGGYLWTWLVIKQVEPMKEAADARFLPFVLIALGGWLLYLLAPVTPFLVGGLLAYLGNPAVNRLVR